jgi:rubrerythrin
MDKFSNVNDILDFAIKNEQMAIDFYINLGNKSRNEEMKLVFEEFAQEEVKHKARLQKIKDEGVIEISEQKIQDLKISDYTVNITPKPDMPYEEALILAMNREKAAFRLYMNLSARVDDTGFKELFLSLAQEESKHKLRFELEYDEYVLREN